MKNPSFFLVILLVFTLMNESETLNNFYGSCSGECTSLSSPLLYDFISQTNANETFCLETINEYMTLNESIRICISNNLTLTNSSSTFDSYNLTIVDYLKLSDRQALLSFNSEVYHKGLFQKSQCYNAARRYICQHFFPLCDVSRDESTQIYNLCMSSCENYYASCNSRELIDFRCLSTSNGINRVYQGSWKSFDMADSVMCTGNSMTLHSSLSGGTTTLITLLVLLYFTLCM